MATIRKRGEKYQVRIQLKGFEPVGKSFSGKADAEAWGKITESEMLRGVYIKRTEAETTTLGDALGRYQREVTEGKRGKEVEFIRIKVWRATKLATKTLAALRSADFAKYRDERLSAGISPITIRRELSPLSHLFNIARKEWGFERLGNPVEGVSLPSVQNARCRLFLEGEEAMLLGAFTPAQRDEKGRLGSGSNNPWFLPLVRLAIETAMRRGELLALRWENVRLADRVAYLPMTKNGKSRTVPLSGKAIEVLKAMPRSLAGRVFPTTANAVKLGFVRAVERARKGYQSEGGDDPRVMVDLHFHDLRHIAITRLAEKLPNIIELAAVSGHEDVRMLRRYYHPKAEALALKIA